MRNEGENIWDYLTRLIAEHDGVKPEEITVEYMHEQRVRKIYPRYGIHNSCSLYDAQSS
jgi:hypothetical protein